MSICARKARNCQNSTASLADGAKAAARREKLDGMWVKTIVLSRPILLAILAASQRDVAVSTWETKKTKAKDPSCNPNLVENQ